MGLRGVVAQGRVPLLQPRRPRPHGGLQHGPRRLRRRRADSVLHTLPRLRRHRQGRVELSILLGVRSDEPEAGTPHRLRATFYSPFCSPDDDGPAPQYLVGHDRCGHTENAGIGGTFQRQRHQGAGGLVFNGLRFHCAIERRSFILCCAAVRHRTCDRESQDCGASAAGAFQWKTNTVSERLAYPTTLSLFRAPLA
jgi:hypothetical protein